MSTVALSSSFIVIPSLVINSVELIKRYFHGIDIFDQAGINLLNDSEVVNFYILAAQTEIENYLNVKLIPQTIIENKDFNRDDLEKWGYIRTTYQVVEPLSLTGYIGTVKQLEYPLEWLTYHKTNDKLGFRRAIAVVPNSPSAKATVSSVAYFGYLPQVDFWGNYNIPNYWTISYKTGFATLPADILNIVGKLASLNLFNIAGDLILGAGISSQSLSIDSLSQNISTSGQYAARIKAYLEDLARDLPNLRAVYKGLIMTTC